VIEPETEPPFYVLGLPRPLAWAVRGLVWAGPLLLVAAIAYLVLIATGVAPAPILDTPDDGDVHDSSLAFVVAFLGLIGFGTVEWFRRGATTAIALAIAGLATGGLFTLLAR
jgi:hypothetical protein